MTPLDPPPADRREKRALLAFFATLALLVLLATCHSGFNPFALLTQGESFWRFLSEDFFPPRIPL